jgi:hypothetical protein
MHANLILMMLSFPWYWTWKIRHGQTYLSAYLSGPDDLSIDIGQTERWQIGRRLDAV